MILQLTLYSLLFLLLMLAAMVVALRVAPPSRQDWERSGPRPGAVERLEGIIAEALPVYVLFAGYALLMFFSGKPDRLPQYLAWLVIALQTLRAVGLLLGWGRSARALAILSLLALVVLWARELPFLSAPPP